MPDVSVELKILMWSAILGLAQIIVAASASTMQRGVRWNLGPRDEAPPLTGMAGRLDRAFWNFMETFPIFAVAVIAAGVVGKYSNTSMIGAYLYLISRIVYVPLYAFGVPLARTLAWTVSVVGIVMVIAVFFQ
jgi:uncharacterized MAPEG superfamily protein